ncbi:ATP-binding protein [Stenomitos frigidus]|uniref:ATP-binding protein n=1 Tax=Stenomitos frigidus ULC18 TaxID=2107698 RepID=A0A2T1ELU1_9CYAN|nr:ATP-binding protein [Stenomitos frigidus]PSB33717.1 ATP-binding protein [Stenomitos frigidus ULC18]
MPSVKRQTQEDYDIAEPRASAMIESLRAFGYNIQTAIADLIDNSISAEAKNVWLTFFWDGSDSYMSIRDDGRGMTEEELVNAMRPGSQSPLEQRNPNDLGRFGLGLKTASFSQCRRLTVASRHKGCEVAIRRWDLDYVNQTDQWRLLRSAAKGSDGRLTGLKEMAKGTIVLWECMDRMVGDARTDDRRAQEHFLDTVEKIENHLAMVFHRFLEKRSPLKIWLNDSCVEPWNPFLADEKATQMLPEEKFCVGGENLIVQPYVLPHHSKIDSNKYARAAGIKGWNAHQGFYVYRNERLLVAGDWLGLEFKKEEHCKLARIQVDLPNSMDSDWNIDVKKSGARPPASLKADLRRIAGLTRKKATEIYRHRGKAIARQVSASYSYLWEQKVKHGKTFYRLNRKHPLVEAVLSEGENLTLKLKALLRLVEETVPVPLITLNSTEHPYSQTQPFEGVHAEELIGIISEVLDTLLKNGWTIEESKGCLSGMEPFQKHEDLIVVALERYQNQEDR